MEFGEAILGFGLLNSEGAGKDDQVLFLQAAGAASRTVDLEPGTYTLSFLAASFKPSGRAYEAFSATFTLGGCSRGL